MWWNFPNLKSLLLWPFQFAQKVATLFLKQIIPPKIKIIYQGGFLSHPMKIKRGCRQGDPISCYHFVLAGEILALLITLNPQIVGLNIGSAHINLHKILVIKTILLHQFNHLFTSVLAQEKI